MNDFIAHILVVDDDEGIRSLIKQYLNENNFLVTTSDSAENAEEKISIIKFDLIVLDVMMTGKNRIQKITNALGARRGLRKKWGCSRRDGRLKRTRKKIQKSKSR